jgi:hypothetical protein
MKTGCAELDACCKELKGGGTEMKNPMVLYSSSKAFSCKFMRDWESCSHCPAAVSDKGAKKLLDSSCIRIFWRDFLLLSWTPRSQVSDQKQRVEPFPALQEAIIM